MTEDQFPDVLRQAAKHYNTPPATPREAMWARIEAERRAQTGRPRKVLYMPWVQWGIGIAAVLVLGIGLGRISVQPEVGQTVAVTQPATPTVTPGASAPAPDAGAALSPAYQVVATEHLSRAEALLTAFRAQADTGEADAQVSRWAGDLLSSTRLLLDSPAAEDPQLRVLLQDLELILAQISQIPSRRAGEEIELIERSLEQGGVMPRLRTAVPAGPPITTT
jgi:hypothetical protein